MHVTCKNLYYRATSNFNVYTSCLNGEIISFLPDGVIIPEECNKYKIVLNSGQLSFDRKGLELFMQETIFSHLSNSISEFKLILIEPEYMGMKGKYLRLFPFEILFKVNIDSNNNNIYCTLEKVSVLGLSVKRLMTILQLGLMSLVDINGLNEAVVMRKDTLTVDPRLFLPGLRIEGYLTKVIIKEDQMILNYGNGILPEHLDRDIGINGGFLSLKGGFLKATPFLIQDTNILVTSPDFPFLFGPNTYRECMCIGKTSVSLDGFTQLMIPPLAEVKNKYSDDIISKTVPIKFLQQHHEE